MNIFFNCVLAVARVVYYCAYNVKVEGRENLPSGGYVIASNHRSFADPPLIAVTSGSSQIGFVAKEELFKNPIFGGIIKKLGAFPVSRGNGEYSVIEESIATVEKGKRLVIFPEGTRSKTGKIGRGKTGVALIAARSGAPVVPAGIIFDGKLHFRSKITIKYGKPILPEDINISDNPTSRELKELKGTIMNSIIKLVEGDENGGN